MADKGIIFSAPMVRALRAGTKKQTRRILKPQPHPDFLKRGVCGVVPQWPLQNGIRWFMADNCSVLIHPGFAPGDRLYVREHWKSTPAYDDLSPSEMGGEEPLRYLADDATFNWAEADGHRVGKHRQGMHMPRWASRLWLAVAEVRVQRLQDISAADVVAEGIDETATAHFGNPIKAYAALWNSLHGSENDQSWEANPWIVAVSFTVNKGNIDG